jgi:hypothetical protein
MKIQIPFLSFLIVTLMLEARRTSILDITEASFTPDLFIVTFTDGVQVNVDENTMRMLCLNQQLWNDSQPSPLVPVTPQQRRIIDRNILVWLEQRAFNESQTRGRQH